MADQSEQPCYNEHGKLERLRHAFQMYPFDYIVIGGVYCVDELLSTLRSLLSIRHSRSNQAGELLQISDA